jgi:hypothetical protein
MLVWGEMLRQLETSNAHPAVGHPIVDVEATRGTKVISPVDSTGKHDVGDGAAPFLRQ